MYSVVQSAPERATVMAFPVDGGGAALDSCLCKPALSQPSLLLPLLLSLQWGLCSGPSQLAAEAIGSSVFLGCFRRGAGADRMLAEGEGWQLGVLTP